MNSSAEVLKIYMADLYHDYLSTRQHVPLGIGYIGEYLKKKFPNRVEITLFKSTERFLDAIDQSPPDLVALSNYTWNHALNRFVGERIKSKAGHDIPIVMGGPNIRTDENGVHEFLEEYPFVDRCILFAGERPMAEIVGSLLEMPGESPTGATVRGMDLSTSFALVGDRLSGGSVIDSEKELDFVPSPYLSGALDEFLDAGFLPIVETNRGCPFSCTFCVWGISALSKLKLFSLDRVFAELEYIAGYGRNFSEIVFADANFGIIKRDVDIAQKIKDLYIKQQSFQAVQLYWSKSAQPHMVDIGRILGKLTHTYVAFQSLDPVVLEAIKRKNISTEKLVDLIDALRDYTHSTQTDLLVGLPNEDFNSHIRSLDGALRYGINLIMGGEIRVLPGSEMDSEKSREKFEIKTKHRLCEGQYGYYDSEFVFETEESIRATSTMSEPEMIQLRIMRTVFFAGVSLGVFRPVVSWMIAKGYSPVEWFKKLAQPNEKFPRYADALEWCSQIASGEWFDDRNAADGYFEEKDKVQGLLSSGAFLKLNYGMLARLICNPEELTEFYQQAENLLIESYPEVDPLYFQELIEFCRARNIVYRILWADDTVENMEVNLSPDTQAELRACGYPSYTPELTPQGKWILGLEGGTRQAIQEAIQGHSGPHTPLEVSRLLESFRSRAILEPIGCPEAGSSEFQEV